MIYTILRITWWGFCLAWAILLVAMLEDDKFTKVQQLFLALMIIFGFSLLAAVVQGFFTWLGRI